MEIIKWVLQLNCHIWIIGPFASHLNAICTWHLSICTVVKGQHDVILNMMLVGALLLTLLTCDLLTSLYFQRSWVLLLFVLTFPVVVPQTQIQMLI